MFATLLFLLLALTGILAEEFECTTFEVGEVSCIDKIRAKLSALQTEGVLDASLVLADGLKAVTIPVCGPLMVDNEKTLRIRSAPTIKLNANPGEGECPLPLVDGQFFFDVRHGGKLEAHDLTMENGRTSTRDVDVSARRLTDMLEGVYTNPGALRIVEATAELTDCIIRGTRSTAPPQESGISTGATLKGGVIQMVGASLTLRDSKIEDTFLDWPNDVSGTVLYASKSPDGDTPSSANIINCNIIDTRARSALGGVSGGVICLISSDATLESCTIENTRMVAWKQCDHVDCDDANSKKTKAVGYGVFYLQDENDDTSGSHLSLTGCTISRTSAMAKDEIHGGVLTVFGENSIASLTGCNISDTHISASGDTNLIENHPDGQDGVSGKGEVWGGVAYDQNSVTLENCRIEKTTIERCANIQGGVLHLLSDSDPKILILNDCTIDQTTVREVETILGGVIYVDDDTPDLILVAKFTDSKIKGTHVKAPQVQGAVMNLRGKPSLTRVEIVESESSATVLLGGVLYINPNSDMDLNDCNIDNTVADSDFVAGGVLYIDAENGRAHLSDCTISGTVVRSSSDGDTGPAVAGGVLHITGDGADVQLTRCTVKYSTGEVTRAYLGGVMFVGGFEKNGVEVVKASQYEGRKSLKTGSLTLVQLTECEIDGQRVVADETSGGAFYVNTVTPYLEVPFRPQELPGLQLSKTTVKRCNAKEGGALFLKQGVVQLRDGTRFSDNHALLQRGDTFAVLQGTILYELSTVTTSTFSTFDVTLRSVTNADGYLLPGGDEHAGWIAAPCPGEPGGRTGGFCYGSGGERDIPDGATCFQSRANCNLFGASVPCFEVIDAPGEVSWKCNYFSARRRLDEELDERARRLDELPPCKCDNFRNYLTSNELPREACARDFVNGLFGVETWCQLPKGEYVHHASQGCDSDQYRCRAEYTKPAFEVCACSGYAIGVAASASTEGDMCRKLLDGICYPRNYYEEKYIGNIEYYGCPEDMLRCSTCEEWAFTKRDDGEELFRSAEQPRQQPGRRLEGIEPFYRNAGYAGCSPSSG
jgi:hypothetical protein